MKIINFLLIYEYCKTAVLRCDPVSVSVLKPRILVFNTSIQQYRILVLKETLMSAILRHLGWIDAPHTQNFEIRKFLAQEAK
jgi:hypothetical protein